MSARDHVIVWIIGAVLLVLFGGAFFGCEHVRRSWCLDGGGSWHSGFIGGRYSSWCDDGGRP